MSKKKLEPVVTLQRKATIAELDEIEKMTIGELIIKHPIKKLNEKSNVSYYKKTKDSKTGLF
jgi:hypothetical protein